MADPIEQCQADRTRVTRVWKNAQLEAQKCKATLDKNPVSAKALGAPKTYADLAASFSQAWAAWAAELDCTASVADPSSWASLTLSGEDYAKAFIKLNDAVWSKAKAGKKAREAAKKAATPAEKPAVEAAQVAEAVAAKTENDAQVPTSIPTPDGTDLSKGVGKGEGSGSSNWMLWAGGALVLVGIIAVVRARSNSAQSRALPRRQ